MQRYFSRIHQRHYRVIKAFLAQSDDLTRSLLQIDTRTLTSFQQGMGAVRSPVSWEKKSAFPHTRAASFREIQYTCVATWGSGLAWSWRETVASRRRNTA